MEKAHVLKITRRLKQSINNIDTSKIEYQTNKNKIKTIETFSMYLYVSLPQIEKNSNIKKAQFLLDRDIVVVQFDKVGEQIYFHLIYMI